MVDPNASATLNRAQHQTVHELLEASWRLGNRDDHIETYQVGRLFCGPTPTRLTAVRVAYRGYGSQRPLVALVVLDVLGEVRFTDDAFRGGA